MNFFFDNNLSPDLAHGLAALRRSFGETIIHLKDRYDPDVPDLLWLQELSTEGGWSVLSADRFKKNSAERKAIRHPKLNVFVLSKSFVKLRAWERTKVIVSQWESISTIAAATAGGAYEVRNRGKIVPYV